MSLMFLETVLPVQPAESLNAFQKWFQSSYNDIIQFAVKFVIALVIFILCWWLIKLVSKLFIKAMTKGRTDKTVVGFLNSVITASLRVLLIIFVLSIVGFDVTTLITAIGAAAVTIGLALKDSLANVASGTLIIINKKFKTGDFIETEGIIGEVIKIEMMYTTLRTYDYKEVMIPNSRLSSNNVINHFSLDYRRVDIPVPISYAQDVEQANEIIMKTILSYPKVLRERNNRVYVEKFNESSVDLTAWAWCKSIDYWEVLFALRKNIKAALDEAGIKIPFNQLDVHFDYPDSAAVPNKEEKI